MLHCTYFLIMHSKKLRELLGNIDIYLLDQIVKDRYAIHQNILDAGCGSGRNMHWFYNNDFNIHAVDQEREYMEHLKIAYPKWKNKLTIAGLDKLPYQDAFFDHIICSAVLHFATNTAHFKAMFSELIRVLKPFGSLFIRMTYRFLLTKELLSELIQEHTLSFLEPLKSTNVSDLRSMTTIVLQKNQ